ncbi:MAG: hypothetical protein LBT16_02740 [Treponema sp.]|jgi:hypothetical protein|nr:hypothetical protein [Treponema sp.]
MKRLLIIGIFFIVASLPAFAEGFYIDIGTGLGIGWTEIDGYNMTDGFNSAEIDEFATDLGLKIGGGPFGSVPLYGVLEFAAMGHRYDSSSNYWQFNSYLIGPGIIFYPVPLIQLALSGGLSWVSNQADASNASMLMYDSKGGFAWNVSAAFDLGERNHGCLIGLRYFAAYNILEASNGKNIVDEKSSAISIIVKYAYRHKVNKKR